MPEEVRADLLLGRDTLSPGLLKAGKAASDASGNVKQLTRDLYEAGKVRATPIVDLQDKDAEAKLSDVTAKLKELGARVADPAIDVKDKAAVAAVAAMQVKLNQLGRKITPRITLEGVARVEAGVLALDAQLDKLDGRNVDVTVSVHQSVLSRISGLFGGGGGAGSGGGGGLSSLVSGGLTSPAGLGALGVGGALLAALAPGVISLGLGGATGLGAIGGGLFGAAQGSKILKADTANINQITTALKTAIGKQKQQLSAALKDANKQYAKDSAFFAPFSAFQLTLQNLAKVVLKPLRPVMAPLTALFTDFGKGLAKLGPVLTQVLDASIPFVHTFLNVLLKAGAQLLPAFSYALNQMVASGALKIMTQSLVILVKGLADFVVALGPGMLSSAKLFRDVMQGVAVILKATGIALSFVANAVQEFVHRWRLQFDVLTRDIIKWHHEIAVIFDGVRHDIAHVWDQIFENSVGMVIRLAHNVETQFNSLRASVANVWDTIWRNTVSRVRNGISDVVGWFQGLPRRVTGALFGFGHSLYAFAHSAMTEFWNALKNVGGSVWHWLTGWVKALPGWLRKLLHINSPSGVFYDIGKNMMLGLFHGIKDHAWKASHAAQQAAAGLNAFGGKFGPGVTQWAPDILRVLAMLGQSSSNLGAVEHRMMQESGGNPNAINLTDINAAMGDPSRGLMQTIMTTFEAYRSWSLPNQIYNPMANIYAGLNYALNSPAYRGRSLSSVMLQPGGYDQGGWLMPGLTLAVNKTGRPERVLPPGQGGRSHPPVLVIKSDGSRMADLIVDVIRHSVSVGGGDVQVVLGEK